MYNLLSLDVMESGPTLREILVAAATRRTIAAECRLLEWLSWIDTGEAAAEIMRPAIELGYHRVEILGGDEFFDSQRTAVEAERQRIGALYTDEHPYGLRINADGVQMIMAVKGGAPRFRSVVLPRPVMRPVECPAMPSAVDGMLPPDLLRMVCCPRRTDLALVARAWRAALRPVVGPQIVEGRGWAAWILPLPDAGEWVARPEPIDVLQRVARAWRRPPHRALRGLTRGLDGEFVKRVMASERPIMRVGPSGADVELALATLPTELHVVDFYATDAIHRGGLLTRWPAELTHIHLHISMKTDYDIIKDVSRHFVLTHNSYANRCCVSCIRPL